MVGSGFSRNAVSAVPGAPVAPEWRDLILALAEALEERSGASAGPVRFSAGDALRLAQDYEVAFGRQSLHRLITETVRDGEYEPGGLHRVLLGLPWRDVFTTNWDTLLERANEQGGSRYSLVMRADQLAIEPSPRILKLHGSLPAAFPLIFTEEDYRLYPTKFAPFVNTVQQSMMETVFVLIGFSGEDPNFLSWLGWVRDNLGRSAPKIYLAGWLDLSDHRRRTLESNNVMAIDMAQHPKSGGWPASKPHESALRWLLEEFRGGQHYPVEEWPRPLEGYAAEEVPKKEPDRPTSSDNGEDARVEEASAALEIWAHNRSLYPGWLSVPFASTRPMLDVSDNWEPFILGTLPLLRDGIERLSAVHELVWRREVLLDRLSDELVTAAEDVLQDVDPQTRRGGERERTDSDWVRAGSDWRAIAVALVTDARYDADRERFDEWMGKLTPLVREDRALGQRLHHERCLWQLHRQQYEKLANELQAWRVDEEGNDPVWPMRKAALLAGIYRVSEARELVTRALEDIRAWGEPSGSLAGQSRESWALWLEILLEEDVGVGFPRYESELRPRWRQLASLRCDAGTEMNSYLESMRPDDRSSQQVPFDLGYRAGETVGFRRLGAIRARFSYRALRLTEVVGLPTATGFLAGCEPLLKAAARNLWELEPRWSASLWVRSTGYDRDKDYTNALTRSRVAAMPAEAVQELAEGQLGVIEFSLARLRADGSDRRVFWYERLRVALESLSRFVTRLSAGRVEDVFNLSLELYGEPLILGHFWFAEPLFSLMRRSWEALPPMSRKERALEFLALPIVGVDGFGPKAEGRYPDPCAVLARSTCPAPARTSENGSKWRELVALLEKGLKCRGEGRKRAGRRAFELVCWGRLNDLEEERLARAVWGETWSQEEELPAESGLSDWMLLSFREPEKGLTEARLRTKWFGARDWESADYDELRRQVERVALGLDCLAERGRDFQLAEAEVRSIENLVRGWATRRPRVRRSLLWSNQGEERRTVGHVASLLLWIQIGVDTAALLRQRVLGEDHVDVPQYELVPGIVASHGQEFDRLTLAVQTGLGSEDFDELLSAARALFRWLSAAQDGASRLGQLPPELVREVGVLVATRRWVAVANVLEIVSFVFERGAVDHREVLKDLVLHGLVYLRKELAYGSAGRAVSSGRSRVAGEEDIDVPLLRLRCVQAAIAMSGAGLEDEPAVVGWLEEAGDDPLPEVRFEIEEWRARVRDSPEKEEADDCDAGSQSTSATVGEPPVARD